MVLSQYVDRLGDPTRSITVYAPPPEPELVEQLASTIGIDAVDYRSLPSVTAAESAFLVLHEDDAFVAALSLESVREFLEPPIYDPWSGELESAAYRAVVDAFDSTVWSGLDRRQLLSVSREIESRAWQVGSGTLRVGFQRAEALEASVPVYTRLAAESTLDIHVYIADDWDRASIPNVTIHANAGDEIGSFWFLVFDGDGDELWSSGMLAEENDPGEFEGRWIEETHLVAHLERAVLESTR